MLSDIFLVRHGEPQPDTGLAYRSLPGPGLSEQGTAQARQAAAFLADKGIEHLFVSPFERAIRTAEQIVARLELPLTFTALVAEHSLSESDSQVQERMHEFVRSIEDSPLQRIAVITHGSPIKRLLLFLTDGRIDLSEHSYDASNNPAPTAGIWHARRSSTTWQAELIFRPAI